jgi:hypothetical protein
MPSMVVLAGAGEALEHTEVVSDGVDTALLHPPSHSISIPDRSRKSKWSIR